MLDLMKQNTAGNPREFLVSPHKGAKSKNQPAVSPVGLVPMPRSPFPNRTLIQDGGESFTSR